jgi:hypothetical protein
MKILQKIKKNFNEKDAGTILRLLLILLFFWCLISLGKHNLEEAEAADAARAQKAKEEMRINNLENDARRQKILWEVEKLK